MPKGYYLEVVYYGWQVRGSIEPTPLSKYVMFSGVKSHKVAKQYLATIKQDDEKYSAYCRTYKLIKH